MTEYLSAWRSVEMGDRVVVEGLVVPAHAAPSPELAAALARWDGVHYWDDRPEGRWLVLARETTAPRERWWLHVALLVLTALTAAWGVAAWTSTLAGGVLAQLAHGAAFSLPLLAILGAHEGGHYFTARYYRVNASPPYFVPCWPSLNALGTFGAFIRIRSPLYDRRVLFDVGAAGPYAGMIVAIPLLIAGLATSHTVPGLPALPLAHQVVFFDGAPLYFGDSLLFTIARAITSSHGVILLTPLALAGWVGLFVTMLNLLPLAQFDGAHALYAAASRWQSRIAWLFWAALLALGFVWSGWWLWAALALLVGAGKLAHPPVVSPERPLDRRRRLAAWGLLLLFAICFSPIPLAG